jgi:hypothetical protein
MPQCKAKSKRSGERCKRAAAIGREVCSMHGGKSPRGLASASLKTGRHSRYLPTRLLDQYEASLSDPELLDLSNEIALLDSRLADVLRRVDTGGAGAIWHQLRDKVDLVQDAIRREDREGAAGLTNEIFQAIRRGQADYLAWQEIADLVERRRRLVESEQKRRVAMHQLVQADDAFRLVNVIAMAVRDAVIENVADQATRMAVLGRVQDGLDAILSAPGQGNPSG